MSEHGHAVDVADGIDTRHRSLEMFVHDDSATLELDTYSLQPKSISDGSASYADQKLIEGNLQLLTLMLGDDTAVTHGGHLRREVELHPTLLEGLL